MGTPFFELRGLIRKAGIHVFSSNYALYGDISRRVMRMLEESAPEVEVYSIDEAFLNLTSLIAPGGASFEEENAGLDAYARRLRERVRQWTGIPVSIGVAQTKTLTKLANRVAKKTRRDGVMKLRGRSDIDAILEGVDVENVWSVGLRHGARLKMAGVCNARQLRSVPCIPMEPVAPDKQGIVCTRSFSFPVTEFKDLKESVIAYTCRAAEKARRQGSAAGEMTVYIMTNPFKREPQLYDSRTVRFPTPTASSQEMARCAVTALKRMYPPRLSL